ncbi:hotdog fold thioesterase [Altererythrobacter luteolus]|uniref:Hotdog fold thioesterase n=2 Tax=Pontixanthobacter luteolus TaxID=295089 RepID=A0A6I4V105_9SPHN|nr:hotdog fold thioesterase [Pontixanthobacter luteolus]
MKDNTRFNTQVMGPMMVRQEGNKCRLRMLPERRHSNLQDMIHGAITLSLIDISLFSAMHVLRESEAGMAVTLELSTQFIGAGRMDQPLDAVVEVMRETGRLMFMRGEVVQEDHLVAAFSGLVRKASPRK